ncbi:MAG: response regulator [Paenibacillaceae bacterium]|nr:response regulator [Paenibacillaceae bacterium]
MYSVLLVDDEPMLRDGMRKFIPWADYGIKTVLEASNVSEALEMIDNHEVDLIFLDVRLPGESGLDLLKTVHERQDGIHVVIMSGYHEFEYARMSVRYRAIDYLVKPIQLQDAARILDWFRTQRDQLCKEQWEEKRWMADLFAKSFYHAVNGGNVQHPAAGSGLVPMRKEPGAAPEPGQLASGLGAPGPFGQSEQTPGEGWLDRMSARYPGRTYRFIAVTFGAPRERFQAGAVAGMNHATADGLLRELPQVEAIVPTELPCGVAAFLLVCREAIADASVDGQLESLCVAPEDAWAYSPDFAATDLPIYASKRYADALRARLFYQAGAGPLHVSHLQAASSDCRLPDGLFKAAQDAAGEESPDKLRLLLSEMLFHMRAHAGSDVASVRLAYKRLFAVVLDTSDRSVSEANGAIDQAATLLALHRTAERLVVRLAESWREEGTHGTHRIVKEVKKYIHAHLSAPIVLAELAEKFQLSGDYLSFLFKKQEGINFNHYLKQARVDKAKELLRAKNSIKVYEVALAVGYQDAKHFTKVFKEMTQLTPAQYMEQL